MTAVEADKAVDIMTAMFDCWRQLKSLCRNTNGLYNHVAALGDDMAAIDSDLHDYVRTQRPGRKPARAAA